MLGVECVDNILFGTQELTLEHPNIVRRGGGGGGGRSRGWRRVALPLAHRRTLAGKPLDLVCLCVPLLRPQVNPRKNFEMKVGWVMWLGGLLGAGGGGGDAPLCMLRSSSCCTPGGFAVGLAEPH